MLVLKFRRIIATMFNTIIKKLADLEGNATAHGVGQKFVFLKGNDTPTTVTQVAYGTMEPGEVVELHVHPTMEEYFYFVEGAATYTIGGQFYSCTPGTFIRIPANTLHGLSTQDSGAGFFYFGVAVEEVVNSTSL
jgi:quercetin dioxygenase-like cupin family protein